MNRGSRFVRTLTVGLTGVLAATLAACASDSDASSNDDDGARTLKIASIAAKVNFGDFEPAIQARLDQANENDEVPGYTFEYEGLIDDLYTTEGAVSAFRRAKEQDDIFAVVGNASPLPPTDYVNQQQLPVFGQGNAISYCKPGGDDAPSYFFSFVGCQGLGEDAKYYLNLGEPSAALVGGADGKTVACIGEDFPSAAEYTARLCSSLVAAGFEDVLQDHSIPAPPAVTSDYSPWVQKAMTANDGDPVDVVAFSASVGTVGSMSAALQRAGFEGAMIGGAGFSPATVGAQAGVTQWTNFATPMSAADNPEIAKIVDVLGDAGIAAKDISTANLVGFFQADMFVKAAAAAAEEGDLTGESIAKAASAFTYEIPGVVGPTEYPKGFTTPTPCSELSTSDGKAWKVSRAYVCDQVFNFRDGTLTPYDEITN